MAHEIVMSVEIEYEGAVPMRITLPIDLRHIGDPAAFDASIKAMNTSRLRMWITGHLVKQGTTEPITTSIVTTMTEAIGK